MSNHYVTFDRLVLAQVMADVRQHVPNVRVSEAWTYHFGGDSWEFHYKDFYWHGSAGSGYEARSEGWSAYLENQGVEGYVR